MLEAKVAWSQSKLIYEAVKKGGQKAWDKNREERAHGLIRTVGPPFDQIPPTAKWESYRQWLKTNGKKGGVEYPIPREVCAMADTVRIPE
jgi:hypothetical protein